MKKGGNYKTIKFLSYPESFLYCLYSRFKHNSNQFTGNQDVGDAKEMFSEKNIRFYSFILNSIISLGHQKASHSLEYLHMYDE